MMTNAAVYLDYNASAPLTPGAREAMLRVMALTGNPSSVHAQGRTMRAEISRARDSVAELCGTSPAHVIFTSGATEAANHALVADYQMGRAGLRIQRLYVCAVEHPCVLAGGRFAADAITVLPVDGDGRLDLKALETALASLDANQGPAMLALQLANNETGVLQPVFEACAIMRAHGGLMVVDAVQGAGRLAISPQALGADFLLISAHKIGGPAGAGALVCAGEVLMPKSLIRGGGQEKGHRGGTENVSGIAGFGAAAREALAGLADMGRLAALRDRMESEMRRLAPDVIIHGSKVARLANTSFFSLPGLKAETAQIAFDMEGVAVSAGAACSSGKVGASHVLTAMGADGNLGAIRVSLGRLTTDAEIDRFVHVFDIINRRRLARSGGANAA